MDYTAPACAPGLPCPVDPKNLGDNDSCHQENGYVGNPINGGLGNKFQSEADYSEPRAPALYLTRYYNSQGGVSEPFGFGSGWTAFAKLHIVDANHLNALRPDGKVITYILSNGLWTRDPDIKDSLASLAGGYRLTTAAGDQETYDATGRLLTIVGSDGRVQNLAYDVASPMGGDDDPYTLDTVTDDIGRQLRFHYDAYKRISVSAVAAAYATCMDKLLLFIAGRQLQSANRTVAIIPMTVRSGRDSDGSS